MPDQPPSIGELVRAIDRVANTLDKLDTKVDNLDAKVDRWREELLELKHQTNANTENIRKLQTQRETDFATLQADRKADAAKGETRRWMVYTALLVAVLSFVSQLYFTAGGLG